MSAYRSREAGASETIVIPTARARWWALVFVVPWLLTFDGAFMDYVAPELAHPWGDDFSGEYHPRPSWTEYNARQATRRLVKGAALGLAFVAVIVALTSLAQAKTTVVVDGGARILRVKTLERSWDVAFGERPTLVEREGRWYLHAGSLAPIAIATRSAPRAPIERLREALAGIPTT
jgi:hypothetical protein